MEVAEVEHFGHPRNHDEGVAEEVPRPRLIDDLIADDIGIVFEGLGYNFPVGLKCIE
jgi:hypothetical protein